MSIFSGRSLILGGLLGIVMISSWSQSAFAVTRIVGPAGNDTIGGVPNDCIASPCATIGHAVDVAITNDFIDILTGTYILTSHIVVDKNLSIRGAGKTQTIIDASGVSRHFDITNLANDVTISDLTMQNGLELDGGAISCSGCNNLTLRRIKAVNNIASRFIPMAQRSRYNPAISLITPLIVGVLFTSCQVILLSETVNSAITWPTQPMAALFIVILTGPKSPEVRWPIMRLLALVER